MACWAGATSTIGNESRSILRTRKGAPKQGSRCAGRLAEVKEVRDPGTSTALVRVVDYRGYPGCIGAAQRVKGSPAFGPRRPLTWRVCGRGSLTGRNPLGLHPRYDSED